MKDKKPSPNEEVFIKNHLEMHAKKIGDLIVNVLMNDRQDNLIDFVINGKPLNFSINSARNDKTTKQ